MGEGRLVSVDSVFHAEHYLSSPRILLFVFSRRRKEMADNDDLLDYEDEEQPEQTAVDGSAGDAVKKEVKGTYVSIHSSGFRDFLLKPEILRAIVDCGFEHPSEGKLFSFSVMCEVK